MAADINKILEGVGLKTEAFDRIKLGRGVVGKVTYVVVTIVAALAIIALRTSDTLLLWGLLGSVVLVFLIYFAGVLSFASKNPGVSLLEGAELIQWRQMDMGIKGAETLPMAPNIEPPQQIGRP